MSIASIAPDVQQAAATLLQLITQGAAAGPTVRQLADAYLAAELPKLASHSAQEARRGLEVFVREIGPDRPAASVRRIDVLNWLASHPNWASPWTKKGVVNRVGRAFSWGIEMELVARNPFHRLKTDPCRPTRRAIEEQEFQAMLRGAPAYLRRLLLFLYLSGCRPSEAAAIRWEDVDLARGVAILREHKTSKRTGKPRIIPLVPVLVRLLAWMQTARAKRRHGGRLTAEGAADWLRGLLSRAGGQVPAAQVQQEARRIGVSANQVCRAARLIGAAIRYVGRGRHDVGKCGHCGALVRKRRRDLCIPCYRRPAIRSRYRRVARARIQAVYQLQGDQLQGAEPPQKPATGLVFVNDRGQRWSRQALCRHLRRLRRRLGLPEDLTAYTLRHGMATRAIRNGVPLVLVSKILGHARTAITEAHYIHVDHDLELLRSAAVQASARKDGAV